MGARRACCAPSFWRGCPSGLRRRRPTVACGPAPRWRAGWPANSGSLRSCPNAAGRRSRRSIGRCRSPAPAIRPRPRRRSARHLKKAGTGCRRGAGPAPGQADRSLGDRRAPHWAEADHPAGVGAQRPAADRAWSPPLQVVVRHRLRAADLRRGVLARCSGMSRTASPSRSSPRSWPCLPARPGRDGIASSCSGSTAPAGTPHRTWSCQMGSGSPTCPRTPPSFSPPSTSGPFWMSRSRTATLRPSPIWNARSQTVAGSSTAISSASGQTSIGGPSQPPRANQPEMVSLAALYRLPAECERPAYDVGAVRVGIVHLGIGAFHRAHQAVYVDDRLAAGGTAGGICGVSLRSADTAEALAPQDGLYTVAVRSGAGERLRVIGSVRRLLVAPDDPAALLDAMTDPAVRTVSLTVTEKGYCHDPATGDLNPDHPDVAPDLAASASPRSAPGVLVEALRRRRAAGRKPFTVLCCDNLPENGRTVGRVLAQFAGLRDPALGRWVGAAVAFPSTMVDRIVPATGDAARPAVAVRLGVSDTWPVMTEPFTQWV